MTTSDITPNDTDTPETDDAFEIPASTLRFLLTTTIPLASADTTLPAINAVMLRRQGNYLTATATDRYVMGKARVLVDPNLPAPSKDWGFPLGLTDAKTLLKLANGVRKDRTARVRFVDDLCGNLSMPVSGLNFEAFGVRSGLRPDRTLKVDYFLGQILGKVYGKPQRVGGLDLRKVAQFTPAQKLIADISDGPAIWWNATCTGDDDLPSNTWACKIGQDFVGIVVGVRMPGTMAQHTDVSDWAELLK